MVLLLRFKRCEENTRHVCHCALTTSFGLAKERPDRIAVPSLAEDEMCRRGVECLWFLQTYEVQYMLCCGSPLRETSISITVTVTANMDMDAQTYTDAQKAEVWVKVAEAYLESDETDAADNFCNKVTYSTIGWGQVGSRWRSSSKLDVPGLISFAVV